MITAYKTVASELKSRLKGESFFDSAMRERYSTASSWYKITPVGVVFPKDAEDVQKVIQFCGENDISVIPRGGGTGLAGQAIGMGIVLDFSRSMNHFLKADAAGAEVEPGIILHDLNERLFADGRFFPVDPVSGKLCTIGGMISTNAAGPHGVKYGSMKDHVDSLTVVLSNGEIATISKTGFDDPSPRSEAIQAQLAPLLLERRGLILERFPKVAKNSSGYNLYDAVKSGTLDFLKLLVGSEGTLAVVAGARLRTTAAPMVRLGAVAYFSDYASTVDATLRGLEIKPAALELMDKTYFTLGQGFSAATDVFIRLDAAAMLYFEFEGTTAEEARSSLSKLADALKGLKPLDFIVLENDAQRHNLFDLREAVSKKMNLEDTFGKTSFIEDVTVPVDKMPDYIAGLSAILGRYGIGFSAYGHAGTGNIHCGTFIDIKQNRHLSIIDAVASEVTDLTISLGGTLSGEHGDGFVRTPFLERLYGVEIYGLFKKVKEAFDPDNIFNPGKIIGPQNTSILHDINFS